MLLFLIDNGLSPHYGSGFFTRTLGFLVERLA
jgi:hypothetical protein